MSDPTPQMLAEHFDRASLWRYRAYPRNIIDGDSISAMIDVGFWARYEAHLRIADVNAPELWTLDGKVALQLLKAVLLDGALAWPWPLRVVTRQRETVISEVRSFERFVADIWIVLANGELVDVKDALQ